MSSEHSRAPPPQAHHPAPNYKVKVVQSFCGREDVRILCQNENGPCPLLAIANILSLRNGISLPHDEISNQSLLSLVASAILDSTSRESHSSDVSFQANLQANLQDCLETLEKLGRPDSTGLDVNLRFNSPFGFEPTRELAVFDLLGISLVHGWLVDPQDRHTAEALGTCTYNQAVELIISALDGAGNSQAISRHASFVASRGPTTPARPGGTLSGSQPSHQQAAPPPQQQEGDLLGLDEDAPTAAPPPTQAVAPQQAIDLLGDLTAPADAAPASQAAQGGGGGGGDALNLFEGLSLEEQGPAAPAQPPPPAPAAAAPQGAGAAAGGADAQQQQARRVAQALLVREFLDLNASQLTVYGISQIAGSLPENKLAVFFRNNHFNVLFKHGSALFLLITDQGYLGVREVVWERLDTVDGDTQLCGPDFLPHKAKAQVAQPTGAAAMNMQALAAIPPEALAGLSEADAAAIAEAAGVFLPPPAAAVAPAPAAAAAAAAAQHPGGSHHAHSEDADLALAMQLQEEEDRRALEAEQRRQQQQEQAQRQQQQQQQQQQYQPQQQFYQDAYQPIPQQQQQRPRYGGAQAGPVQAQPPARRAPVPPAAQESKKDSSCVVM